MFQAEWLLICSVELKGLQTLSRINLRLLKEANTMSYPDFISLLDTYCIGLDIVKKNAQLREQRLAAGIDFAIPLVDALINRRRHRVWLQQERLASIFESILAAFPQTPTRLVFDTHGWRIQGTSR